MTLRDWFLKAQSETFAIAAFNIDSFEIFKAVVIAANNKKSPLIVQFSPEEVAYFGLKNIVDMVENAREEFKIPIFLNLDHARGVDECIKAINVQGFDMVHYDGTDLDAVENAKNCKKILDAARKNGVMVEGEMDKIFGSSEEHLEDADTDMVRESYSDPKKVADFVSQSGIDVFAPVFGNVHGTFPNQPELDLNLLEEIHKAVPNTFLALHGGSGIPAKQIESSIARGKIVKINVNTELRQAFHDSLSVQMEEEPAEDKFYKVSDEVVLALTAVIEGKIELFGSVNKI